MALLICQHACFRGSRSNIPDSQAFIHRTWGKYLASISSDQLYMEWKQPWWWCKTKVLSILILPNQDIFTVASFGDHCMSSTDALWPMNGLWSTIHDDVSCGLHRWIFLLQSPVSKCPEEEANPTFMVFIINTLMDHNTIRTCKLLCM